MRKERGFTLVEIAIVLVIIGLLLGGILRGQELIQNARVRNIIDQQNGIKAAFFGFQDRFRMIPGDLTGGATGQSNQVGSGVVAAGTSANGMIDALDSPLAFQNITVTGFISCQTCTATGAGASDATNSPVNVYGGVLQLVTDNIYSSAAGFGGGAPLAVRHNVKTGNLIPSNVLYEADVKIDDGVPNNGQFRFSVWAVATGVAPAGATCQNGAVAIGTPWQTLQNQVDPNCGAATLIN